MRRKHKFLGMLAISLGLTIILAMVLPSSVWWFILGIGLIAAGLCICRH